MSVNDFTHALLPHAALLPFWVQLSWAVVISAWVLRWSARLALEGAPANRLNPSVKRAFIWRRVWPAVLVALVMLALPVLSGYLALALQTPSLVLVAWALWCWRDSLFDHTTNLACPSGTLVERAMPATEAALNLTPPPLLWACLAGTLLGWALVLDTLNYWPAFFNPQFYAWGFDSASLSLVLALAAVGLWMTTKSGTSKWLVCSRGGLSVTAVLAVYVLLRLPTGNVWDALLDPLVWLVCHVRLWKWARCRYAQRKALCLKQAA